MMWIAAIGYLLAARTFVAVSIDTVAGLQLGRSPPLKIRRVPFLPRRYRQLDGDVDVPMDGTKLRKLFRRRQNVNNAMTFPLPNEIPSISVFSNETPTQVALPSNRRKESPSAITNVQELRKAILDEGRELKDLELELNEAELQVNELFQHDVIQLILKRHFEKSVPGHRADGDISRLALAIEGGGMRGAVGGGMVAAIASLGLLDTFDVVYGSSAGSVIGAYMVSRQMCVDVYTEILTAAQRLFICKRRFFLNLALSTVDLFFSGLRHLLPRLDSNANPGMSVDYVLDNILNETTGIRPIDFEAFRANDLMQPLRVCSSGVRCGKLMTRCFGTKDFFHHAESNALRRADGEREGLFACLQASMTVPGAAGPPVPILDGNVIVPSFDAFCVEPLPYRSAVDEGATHVLVLRSRPQGFQPKSKPGIYEVGVAPLYFRSHGEHKVADFFERGGQQYIYAEDMFTLEQGRIQGLLGGSPDGILIPPPNVLYGVKQDEEIRRLASQRDKWKRAHVFPLSVPKGTPELPTVEQGRDKVLEAVRGGFATAFDLLAPAIGLDLGEELTGHEVAKLFFPSESWSADTILETQIRIAGHIIASGQPPSTSHRAQRHAWLRFVNWSMRCRKPVIRVQNGDDTTSPYDKARPLSKLANSQRNHHYAEVLLSGLPGIQGGKMPGLALGLHQSLKYSK